MDEDLVRLRFRGRLDVVREFLCFASSVRALLFGELSCACSRAWRVCCDAFSVISIASMSCCASASASSIRLHFLLSSCCTARLFFFLAVVSLHMLMALRVVVLYVDIRLVSLLLALLSH